MKNTFFQKSAIGSSILLSLVCGAIFACGDWGWMGYEYQTNFTPETFVNEQYKPFFLSEDLFYDRESLGHGSTRFDDEISQDWAQYLKGKADLETISYFLNSEGTADLNSLYAFTSKNKPSKASEKWSGKIDLKDKKVKAFIEFLHYGKMVEAYSLTDEGWDYTENTPKTIEDVALLQAIEKKYTATNDEFLKNRYWFQTVKGYFYSNKRGDGVSFFNKTENVQPKNTLYYRALSYIAGITGRMGNRGKSNYLYSQVFDKCPKLQTVAVFCFTPKEEKDWNDAFSYAKTTDEKVALWAVHGYYADAERAIENIFSLNPKSEYLDFLLTRLVNQEELKINTTLQKQTVQENKNAIKDSISKTVVSLIDKIAESGKVQKPYLWNCAAGYLQTLDGNYKKADAYLAKAEHEMPKTELAIKQLRLLKFVNNLNKLDKITAKDEAALVSDLNWLYVEVPRKETDESEFRYQNAVEWSKNYLASLYRNQKNPVMADLFVRDPNFYNTTSQLLAMKAFLRKENKTAFEGIAKNSYPLKLEQIINYQAVMSTYKNKINEAIAFMEEGGVGTDTLLANPFNGNIKDCHDCDFVAYQKRKYSEMDFLKTIKVMKENLDKNTDVYTNAMLLGNAFYNITNYGNARTFYEGDIFGYGICALDFDKEHSTIITDCTIAKMYYQKALDAAQNDEQKAKMQYMLAKCERNDYYNQFYKTIDYCWAMSDRDVAFLEWNGFKNLKDKYSKTKFYQQTLTECGYFRTYIAQNGK